MSGMAEEAPDSEESFSRTNGDEAHSAHDGRESNQEISSARLQSIFHKWYFVPDSFTHDFPQAFRTVPSINDSDRIWRTGKDVNDVIGRLLCKISNDTDDNLIPPIMGYFEDIVDTATKQFVDIKRRFVLNEHHTDVTRKMKQAGKIPHFLLPTAPKVNTDLFPADASAELEASYKIVLKRTSEELLDLTIAVRENIDAKLRREAETVLEDIRQAAMQKWMDAQQVETQTNYNRWDHVFPVFDRRRNLVPLSSVIYRTALKECQAKVSRILEQEMQAKKEQHDARRRENEKRREVLRKASSIPHQEAEISVARQVERIIAPLAEDVRRLKELSEQKNRRALDAADPARDNVRSAANARAGTQPNAKLRPEYRREAPRARHTDPQRRNLRVEVCDQPSPGDHRPAPSAAAASAVARENESDAGQRKRRKRKRRERSREDA